MRLLCRICLRSVEFLFLDSVQILQFSPFLTDRLTDIWNVKVCRARFSSRGLPKLQSLEGRKCLPMSSLKGWGFSLPCAKRGDECLLLMTRPRLSISGISTLWHSRKEEARTCEVLPLHAAGAGPFFLSSYNHDATNRHTHTHTETHTQRHTPADYQALLDVS